jgi:hypothetical protein
MGIEEKDYYAFVNHFHTTLEELKIDQDASMKMLDLLNSFKNDIVEEPLPLTLYQKLDSKNGYLSMMKLFLSLMTTHYSL